MIASGAFPFEAFFDAFVPPDIAHAKANAYAAHYINKYAQQQQQHNQQQCDQQQRDQQQRQQHQRKHAQAKAAAAAANASAKAASGAGLPAAIPAPAAAPAEPVVVAVPTANIYETDAAFVIQVDVPGASDPEVVAVGDELKVAAAVAPPASLSPSLDGARVLRRERARAGRYERAFVLPDGVDADGIEARLDAGVLTLTVPKVKPQALAPKKIKVVVAAAGPPASNNKAAAADDDKAADAPSAKAPTQKTKTKNISLL